MSTKLRVILLVLLWVALIAGYVMGDRSYFGVGVGIGLVLVATLVEEKLRGHPKPCGQNPLGDPGHGCALPADGHTMHRCAHGECSWGS